MLKSEIKKLDRLFQEKALRKNPNSIFGGKATEIHHFYSRVNMATRWWYPNAIPVNRAEHNLFESSRGDKMKENVKRIKGKEWFLKLRQRANMIVKNIDFNKVVAYLNGEINDYI